MTSSGGERTRYGLITFAISPAWTREASPSLWFSSQRTSHDTGPSSRQFVLSSPRGEGRLCIATISMPEDMGTFDCERLRKLVEQRAPNPVLSLMMSEPFDRSEWSAGGVSCIGHTRVMKQHITTPPGVAVVDPEPIVAAQLKAEVEESEEAAKEPGAMRDPTPSTISRYAAMTPTIQRDWYVACETDMANVWYCGMNADEAAADIADCEDMLRSISFNRAS